MFDDPKELLAKIRLGEDAVLELKQVEVAGDRVTGPHRNSLADELAAMANGKGGVCVLGVTDAPRTIVGIPREHLDLVDTFVSEVCNDSIDPPLVAHIQRVALPTEDGQGEIVVIKIDVPRSLFIHQSPGGYLIRIGSSKRKMGPELLGRLFQQRSQSRLVRFDEEPVSNAALSDLAPALWKRYRTSRTLDADEELLVKRGMATQTDEGILRPTVAGILMGGRDPRKWLPNAFIQAVAYRGTDITPRGPRELYQLDARDISGPLDEQVIEACRFVHRNMKVGATKSIGRRDVPQFDMEAVFEAMVNAVVHRDYSVYGSKVRLRLFADRLELYSPGSIANTMTVESLAYRQAARNETLASLLAETKIPKDHDWLGTSRETFMDRRGEGVRIILRNSQALSGKIPEYRLFDEAELRLTLFAPPEVGLPDSSDPTQEEPSE
jgi:predicted HTH transcriptional regulator